MTPVPLELPVRPQEAAELARLIFAEARGKRLTDELRNRIAARAARLRLETIRPWFGSLAREPIHDATYYLAVDASGPGAPGHYLLHMAPPAAPTSGIFSKPLLIGRMADAVINAIPFGPADRAHIAAFIARIDPSLAPRPLGARGGIAAAADLPAAFEVFRAVHKRAGKNLAAVCGVGLEEAGWHAIRAGWREGWCAGVELRGSPEEMEAAVRREPGFTHFAIHTPSPEIAARLHGCIRQARSAARPVAGTPRPFDFELSLEDAETPMAAGELAGILERLKAADHVPQWVIPRLNGLDEIEELAAVARRFQCGIGFRAAPELDAAALERIARATAGRFYCKMPPDASGVRERLEFLAGHLV